MNKGLLLPVLLSFGAAGCAWLRGTAPSSTANAYVTMGSLLHEMMDRDSVTYFPAPAYTTRSYSSYDRASTGPGKAGWFANDDRSQFIRVETNAARRELVMLDASGPGAITRFWVTTANSDGSGILRVYIDNKAEIEGRVLDVLSGGKLCGAPLSSSVSPATPYLQRGHNLYLPIPYSAHCKVTYESAAVWAKNKPESFYYNIETRTYAPGTMVESFSPEGLARNTALLDDVNKRLAGEGGKPFHERIRQTAFTGEIAPAGFATRTFDGPAAIRELSLCVNNGRDPQALRSTVLELGFDGKRTVWAPVGDFFGTGYKLSPYKAWYTQVGADGVMRCLWVMPFKKSCTLTIRNLGTNAVTLTSLKVKTSPYVWDRDRSMYFGAGWKNLAKIRTRRDNRPFDINYTTLSGRGLVIGTGVTVFNLLSQWWGEGDEKIFVDGESFPSYIGTGTEDYYGYAWCSTNRFEHPFIAQPDGTGDIRPGYSVNLRHRILDAIPFTSGLRLDMELFDWTDTHIDYATMAYWYLRPGGSPDCRVEVAEAQRPVTLQQERLDGDKIALEGEYGGHLQSVCRDELGNLYWSHTVRLIKTDKHGHILLSVPVPPHHGGMCYTEGKIYVAVCKIGGPTPRPQERLQVSVYDSETLKKIEDHLLDKNDRAGSIAYLDKTFFIGCLRGNGLSPSQVRLYRYTRDFKFIDSHDIETGEKIPLGTENIVADDKSLYLSMYTKLLLQLSPSLTEIAKYRQEAALGFLFEGDSFWYGISKSDKEKKLFHSWLIRKQIKDIAR